LRHQVHLRDDGANKVLDTALVLAADETDVTLLTPAASPGVLDNPVLGAPFLTITDKQNTVVHARGRANRVVDTSGVEAPIGSIKSNRKRAVGVKSSDHGILVGIDHEPLGEVILDLGLVDPAGLVNTNIRIVLLADHANTDSIGESIGHQTTVAALIADLLGSARIVHAVLIAVNELLLRDERKSLVCNEPGTLHAASGRE